MNNFKVNGKFIENGSYVLVKKDEVNLNEKDAFLFIVDRSATVKKFKKDPSNIYLVPESKDEYHKPIILSADENIMVNGKVVDVFNF
jgi:SOS-response transcriptional repressor LexA